MKLSFEITKTESRRRKDQGWRAPPPGRATTSLFPFGASQQSSVALEGSIDLKTPYIKVSDTSREEAARRSRNTEIQTEPATVGGELSSGATTGEISYPSKIKSLITMMRRE